MELKQRARSTISLDRNKIASLTRRPADPDAHSFVWTSRWSHTLEQMRAQISDYKSRR
jgi:hypothetical protein